LLDQEPGLRRALADYTSAPEARTGLVRDLLGDRVSPATLDVVSGLASARWSVPRDLADAAEELAVLATAAAAGGAGNLDNVEDELFRFGRIASGEPELDRKSTRLNSSHLVISYAVFCLKKKNT